MGHDASKVLMGATQSSDKEVSCHDADPASFPAGRAVRGKSDGKLSLSSGDGQLLGVSLGKSLSDTKKTAVCRTGNRVPLELNGYAYLTKNDLTFYKKVDSDVSIEFVDGETAGAETVDVADGVISVGIEDETSTATQIKAALDASEDAMELISVAITGTASDPQEDFAEDAIDGQIPTIGAAVRVDNSTGKAVPTGGTATGAQYASGILDGIQEDASEIPVAMIDMGGGL